MKRPALKLAEAYVSITQSLNGKALEAAAAGYLKWLREHGEWHRLPEIIRAIDAVWKKKYGAATITVDTPHPLSREMRAALEEAAHGADLVERVRPELIGGARIRIDDRILDGSIAGHLSRLSKILLR